MTSPHKKEGQLGGAIAAALLIFIGVLYIGGKIAMTPAEPKARPEPDPRTDPIVMAQQFVKQKLKSPRSAKFPWSFDDFKVYQLAGEGYESTYEVESWVDSQNIYGALIRQRFTARMQDQGNEKWQLLHIEFE